MDGSTTELQKAQSLKGRTDIIRDDIYSVNDKFYCVLSVFKKHITSGD